jgi:hypothetical protein
MCLWRLCVNCRAPKAEGGLAVQTERQGFGYSNNEQSSGEDWKLAPGLQKRWVVGGAVNEERNGTNCP